MASGVCLCGHSQYLHRGGQCTAMLPDGRGGMRQCHCMAFVDSDEDD